jgi:hypothetical protein
MVRLIGALFCQGFILLSLYDFLKKCNNFFLVSEDFEIFIEKFSKLIRKSIIIKVVLGCDEFRFRIFILFSHIKLARGISLIFE